MPYFANLSVVVPMWNEEEYARRSVGWAIEVCEALVLDGEIGDYEILVVNDASTDDTRLIAEQLTRENDRVRVVHHTHNGKLGRSLRSGFAQARGEVVLYTDADLPVDLHETAKALRLLRNHCADIVSAYRYDRAGEGIHRAVYSAAYNAMVCRLFSVRLRDVNFAFKVIRRSVLDSITLRAEGSFVSAELLVSAHRLGFRIVQFGVEYFPRTMGESTLASPAAIAHILYDLARIRPALARLVALSPSERGTVPNHAQALESLQ